MSEIKQFGNQWIQDRGDGTIGVYDPDTDSWDTVETGVDNPAVGMPPGQAFTTRALGAAKEIPYLLSSGLMGGIQGGLEGAAGLAGRFDATKGTSMGLRSAASNLELPIQDLQAQGDRIRAQYAPLSEENPIFGGAGDIIGGNVLPGGRAINAISSGAYASNVGDTPAERGIGMAAGVLGSLGLDPLLKGTMNRVRSKASRMGTFGEKQRNRAESIKTLKEAGMPLTPGQRTGDPRLLAKERVLNVASNDQVLKGDQQENLAEITGKALGIKTDQLSPSMLDDAAKTIGRKFEVAKSVDPFFVDDAKIGDIIEKASRTPNPDPVLRAAEDVRRLTESGISGAEYIALRGDISSLSNQLYKKSDELEAGLVDDLLELLDDGLAKSDPLVGTSLKEARKQWKLLMTIEAGRVIGATDDINPISMQAAIRRKWGKGIRRGKYPEGDIGEAIKVLDAYNRIALPHRTSKTAELLAPWLYKPGKNPVAKVGKVAARAADEAINIGSVVSGAAQRELAGEADEIGAAVSGLLGLDEL